MRQTLLRRSILSTAALLCGGCTTDLGDWYPADINDDGVIVGNASGKAVVLRGSGPLVELAPLPGQAAAKASAIANDGTIAGVSLDDPTASATVTTVVVWNAAGVVRSVQQMTSTASDVTAMNNRGVIVGTSTGGAEVNWRQTGWVYDPAAEGLQELPVPPDAADASPRAINDAGEIAGSVRSISGGGYYAVRWAPGTHAVSALAGGGGTPAKSSHAYGINSAGNIVGVIGTNPVLWRGADDPVLLPMGNHRDGYAQAINDHDVIVGAASAALAPLATAGESGATRMVALDLPLPQNVAMRWKTPTTFEQLAEPNSAAVAINDAGLAVGHISSSQLTGALRFP